MFNDQRLNDVAHPLMQITFQIISWHVQPSSRSKNFDLNEVFFVSLLFNIKYP